MKTDQQILTEMLERAGIAHKANVPDVYPTRPKLAGLVVEAGYMGFYTVFTFTEDGNLKSIEAYE